jgi:hypothetical protein
MKAKYWALRVILPLIFFTFPFFNTTANSPQDSDQGTEGDAIFNGASLFDGSLSFTNGGPACNACHNVNNDVILSGGLLAKDLTNVYARMGDAGLTGILGAPPFPAMTSAYSNSQLTENEIENLKAFLQFVDANGIGTITASNNEIFLVYGPVGLALWLIMVYFFWLNRKKESVKKEIFDRQIKPIN